MRQRRRKLPDYKAELAEREATGADPGATSLQDIRYGGTEDASGLKCVITITDQAVTIEWDPALPAGPHPVSEA
jgi:hypothetical protein